MSKKTSAHFSALGANLLFGINFSVIKFLTPHLIKSFGLNVARAVVATSLFWLLFLLKKDEKKIEGKDWWRFIACAATGIAINQMLFVKGVSLTLSIHASLLMLVTPILITFIAAWMMRERITLYKAIGLALGVSGAVILISSRDHSGIASDVLLGDILVIINAISYSFYMVLVRKLMVKYKPIQVMRWVFTLGMLMILPFGWREFLDAPWQAFTMLQWGAVLFVALGATFLAYLLNLYGIQHLGSSVAGAYIYSQPVFAAIIATLFLHEPFTWLKLLAAGLIFAGVYLATWQKSNE